MRLSVVGTGHVGLMAGACLAEMGNQVLCADNDEVKIADLSRGVLPFFEPGLEKLVQQNLSRRLAYKPNTDDMRNAPSIDVINLLREEGARVRACDPVALEMARGLWGDAIELCASPYRVAEGSDALVLVTEWDEFRDMDLERLKGLMSRPILVDGRNLFQPQRMVDMGWEYYGTGR